MVEWINLVDALESYKCASVGDYLRKSHYFHRNNTKLLTL